MTNLDQIIQTVEAIVGPVYLVGGACRDLLLKRECKDYDFTTPLSPERVEQKIRDVGFKPYTMGKRFGTIGLKIGGKIVEITTFRKEEYRDQSRKPTVQFVKDITADLSRRDFTINAIAKTGSRFIDPFNGREDIQSKLIRCVGKPVHRFKEDPLRMLRACRFASQLGFEIHDTTFKAMKQNSYKILSVSKERWVMELDKLLTSSHPFIGLKYLMESRLMNFILPELALQFNYNQNSQYHNLTLFEHTVNVVDDVEPDISLRWAALLHDVAKPFVRTDRYIDGVLIKSNYISHDLLGKEFVCKIGRYLKWSNERIETVSNLVLNHLQDDSPLREADNAHKVK
jgi:tRNA nucleotidyltransferase (CCA-adding enzyme)